MAQSHPKNQYVPGMYAKKRPSTENIVDQCIRELELQKSIHSRKEEAKKRAILHHICFSRKIGVGALEIADILGKKIGYKVVDREIIEHIAGNNLLQSGTLDDFDERYRGRMSELASLLFGEKSFTMGDYMRHLAGAVMKVAETGPTIFVGRAAHLILPRHNVLAVRFISSREHRIKRVAKILNVAEQEAARQLDVEDKMQKDFFKKNFHKKDASPYEFDLVINRDYITDAKDAAELVRQAFVMKFGALSEKKS
jgi:cytidylate kinase